MEYSQLIALIRKHYDELVEKYAMLVAKYWHCSYSFVRWRSESIWVDNKKLQ